jgi:RHS repeat-associated protein
MNRAAPKSYSDGVTPAVTYTYGDHSYPACQAQGVRTYGRLTTVTATPPSGPTIVNNYSAFEPVGRVKTSSQQFGAALPYTFTCNYDLSGALSSVTYPSLRTVTNAFDPAGRIAAVTGTVAGASTPYASNVLYAPQGAISNLNLYNGLSEAWGFNTRQQPTSLAAVKGGTTLMNLTWTYNPAGTNNGNVAGHTIQRSTGLTGTLTENYTYTDPANRLKTAVEAGGPSQTYLYDAFGNRAVQAGSWMPSSAITPQSLTEFTNNQWMGSAGNNTYNAGNQTFVAGNSGTFTYDGENRLLTANVFGEGLVTFAYDGEGRRVQKASGLGTTTYVHDAMGNLAAEYSTQASTATGRQYLTVDTLGSTRLVTDGSGNPVRCIDYAPFGEEIPSGVNGRSGCYETLGSPQFPAPPDVESVKFTGKERDAETGLDYFGARYFSGAQGRFTSPDKPFADQHVHDPQSWNLYSYARNNPLRYIDDDGEAVKETIVYKTYDVRGKTAAEAHANALAASGISADGQPMMGSTSGPMKIANMVIDPGQPGGFEGVSVTATETLTSADVILNQTITLPKWVESGTASPEEQTNWNTEVGQLKGHELGHADINREQAQKLDKSLPGTSGTAAAPTSAQAYKAAGQQLTQKLNQKVRATGAETKTQHQQYDKRTDHGRKKPDEKEE